MGQDVDVPLIDAAHERRGWGVRDARNTYHIGYHFVVLPDGTLRRGRPEWMPGAHCRGHNDHIGICLVGNFSSADNPGERDQPARPTREQLDTLDRLLRRITVRYHLTPDQIHGHSDFAATACPGDRLSLEAIQGRLREPQ